MTPLAAAFLLQLGYGIVVETDSPDAHCPDLHQTREAVSSRLGAVEGGGFRARYTIVHARGEMPRDFVLLELIAPGGEVQLRRELPIGESCRAVAEAIALVLDEHFRALVAPESAETEAPSPDPEPSPAAEAPPTSVTAKPVPEVDAPTRRWLASVEMSALFSPANVALGLRLEASLSRIWHAGVEANLPVKDRVEAMPGGGEARARTVGFTLHFGAGPEIGAVRPYFGPALFASIERGYTTAPLVSSAHYRVLGGAAVEVGARVRLSDRWRTIVFASAGGIFAQSAEFIAGGREVLNGTGWVGRAGLGLAYAF